MNEATHLPVLLHEVADVLVPSAGGTIADCTFGGGGYSREFLRRGAERVFGIDRDPSAIEGGKEFARKADGRVVLIQGRFSEMDRLLCGAGAAQVDGIALDLGVSSMQLDTAERGFSFQHDGPLDMRMGGDGPSAEDLVNSADEATLAGWFWRFSDERFSRRIARAIVRARNEARITRTLQLASVIADAVPRPAPNHHPATRAFQALRIAVNDELGELERGLEAAERVIKPGGRCAVVSFHSLEDRYVKTFFRDRSTSKPRGSRHMPDAVQANAAGWRLLTARAITPGKQEIDGNPRARSAKLRAAERLAPDTGIPEMGIRQ